MEGGVIFNGRLLCFSLGAIAIQCAGSGASCSVGLRGGGGGGVLRGVSSDAKTKPRSGSRSEQEKKQQQQQQQQQRDWQSLPALLSTKRRVALTIEYVGTEYSGWQRCELQSIFSTPPQFPPLPWKQTIFICVPLAWQKMWDLLRRRHSSSPMRSSSAGCSHA